MTIAENEVVGIGPGSVLIGEDGRELRAADVRLVMDYTGPLANGTDTVATLTLYATKVERLHDLEAPDFSLSSTIELTVYDLAAIVANSNSFMSAYLEDKRD